MIRTFLTIIAITGISWVERSDQLAPVHTFKPIPTLRIGSQCRQRPVRKPLLSPGGVKRWHFCSGVG